MGLFIGASILTILELFDYIYEVRLGITRGEMTICRSLILRSLSRITAQGRGRLLSARACFLLLVHECCFSPHPRHGGGMGTRVAKPQSHGRESSGLLHQQGGSRRDEEERRLG